MSAHIVVHILLAVLAAETPEQADALIEELADPFTRRQARKEWRELQAASVKTIRSAS